MTQTTKILSHMKRGRRISPLQALSMFGVFRLSSRIHQLRRDGWNVQSEMVEEKGKRFKVYWL
jgi:hypothetical protein